MMSQDGNWNTVKLMHDENSLELAVNDILAETWAIGKYIELQPVDITMACFAMYISHLKSRFPHESAWFFPAAVV